MKSFTIAVAATAVLAVASATVQAETKLTYGSYLPDPHLVHKKGLEPMFKTLEKKTNGSLKFELFTGGAMGGGKAMLSIVRDRVTDSSIIIDAYVKRDLPASAALTDLAILGEDAMVMAGAVNELQLLNCPQCEKERARNKVKALAFYSTSTYHLMCTKPVATLADIEGLKIRATSAFGILAKELGGTPVGITSSEIYEGMQRGQIDCTLGSPAWLTSYNLQDVVHGITAMPVGTYHGALVYNMNVNTWKGLSDGERKAIIEEMPGLVRRIVENYEADANSAIEGAKGLGVTVVEPGSDLVAKYKAHQKTERDRVVAKAKEAGVDNAEKMIDDFFAMVAKWNRIVADIDRDPAKFEQALRERVFSKL